MSVTNDNRTDEESHQVHDQLGTAPLPGPPASSADRCCTALNDRRVQSYICVVLTVTIMVAMVPVVVTLTSRSRMHSHHQPPTEFDEPGSPSSFSQTTSQDFLPVSDAQTRYDHALNTLYKVSSLDALTSGTTPQNRALTWIADFDKEQVPFTDEERLTQRYILALMFFATGGGDGKWYDELNFLSESHECHWAEIDIFHIKKGVLECDGEGFVTSLDLHHNRLEGEIPAEIGSLERLHTLYLSANNLHGTIPAELGNLTNIQSLFLPGNDLVGSIPHQLSQLINLEYLNLSRNKLQGTVPVELANLVDVSYIYLEANDLNGNLDFLCDAWKDLTQIKVDLESITCDCCDCCS